jgi:hypothetical protein
LGGRRLTETDEASEETAARRVSEETHQHISKEEVLKIIRDSKTRKIRLSGCYDLYMGWLNPELATGIVAHYKSLGQDHPLACAYKLIWVPIDRLLCVAENDQIGYHITFKKKDQNKVKPISHLTWSLCVKEQATLRTFFDVVEFN